MAIINRPLLPQSPQVVKPESLKMKRPVIEHTSEKYKTFAETMKSFTNDVNQLQQESGTSIEKFLTGEIEDVHDVMIAVEKASVSFELMMELRNKMIEGYHEIFRMQV